MSDLYQAHRICPSSLNPFIHSPIRQSWEGGLLMQEDYNSQSAPVRLPGATKECRLTALLESGLFRTASQPASHGPGLLCYTPCHSKCRGCPDQEGVSWERSWVMCWGGPHLLFQIDLSCTALGKQSKPCLFSCSLHTYSLALGWVRVSSPSSFTLHALSPPLSCPSFPNNEMGTKGTFEFYSEYYGELKD